MRDAVLQELELAPLWRLRQQPAVADADLGAAVAALDWDALHAAYPEWIGAGERTAEWVFAGIALDSDSDASRLFDAMLGALQLQRAKNVFVLPPVPGHAGAVLMRQLALLQPRVIIALGQSAVQCALNNNAPLDTLRGRVHDCMGTPLIASFHPDDLLKAVSSKALAWQDLCLALTTLQNNPKEIPNA